MIAIIMGVSGSGKSTIGHRLAELKKLKFIEADSFHSTESIRKMKASIPLTDSDRIPWLERLSVELAKCEREGGAILACSALKELYREILTKKLKQEPIWIFLKGDKATIKDRMAKRKHFMPKSLLDSQFETLEVPDYGIHIDIDQEPSKVVSEILNKINE